MNPLLKKNLKQIRTFCQRYDVEKLYAFGSSITDHFSERSDIDLIVKFKNLPFERYTDNYFELLEILERLFDRKVDLMTENSLSNPYFIKKVNRTKKLIYEG
ncbi:MAG: nucleotidyltransferase domain-containing protein [Deltaproteobacteria bacterium]|nr:MAG: nucleotidyltransferase domain-containing protein [Deltaproteobacteria bacterium]